MNSNEQKKEIIEQIDFMKNTSLEELLQVFKSSIFLYFKSIITFGINSKQAKESIEILKEMYKILLKERKLLNIIARNIDSIDLDDTSFVVDMLDELNDDTYLAYDGIFEDIETSCTMQKKDRILRPRNRIDSLITNKEYEESVMELIKKRNYRQNL